jgi:hypothetical protein
MVENNNSKKYYSIKVGCSNCLGTPLEININQSPEYRIKDLSDLHRIDYFPAGEFSCYTLVKKQGEEALFQMVLNEEGDIRITSNKSHAVTINQINEERANDLIERLKEEKSSYWKKNYI